MKVYLKSRKIRLFLCFQMHLGRAAAVPNVSSPVFVLQCCLCNVHKA